MIINPYIFALISGLIIILSAFIPQDVYYFYIKEPNYIFMNFNFIFFVLLCILTFCTAAALSARIANVFPIFKVKNPRRLFMTSAIFNFLINIFKIAYIHISFDLGKILAVYFGNVQGYVIKDDLNEIVSGGRIGWIGDLSLAAVAFMIWIYLCSMKRNRNLLLTLVLSIFLFSISNLISLSRDSILTLLLIAFIIYISQIRQENLKDLIKISRSIVITLVIFLSIFVAIDVARNKTSGTQAIIGQLMGYFPASVNRAAAVYEKKLKYPNSGSGYYSTQFIWDFPVVSNVVGFPKIARSQGLDIPYTPNENYKRQFNYVRSYGFDEKYIWATVFGFLYADYGNWSVIYFLIYGFLIGFLYRNYNRNGLIAGLLFPYSLVTVIKWISVVSFSQRSTVIFLVFGIFLVFIDQISTNKE